MAVRRPLKGILSAIGDTPLVEMGCLLPGFDFRLFVKLERLNAPVSEATLGGSTDTKPLRDYAEQVFGSAFPSDSVVTENRKSVADFLGDATIEHVLQWQEGSASVLEPAKYPTQQAAVRAWFALFFPDQPQPADVEDAGWRSIRAALCGELSAAQAVHEATSPAPQTRLRSEIHAR